MLTQVAALELGPRGIRVNAVAPGFVHTPLTEPAAAVPGVVEEYLENTALGRAGTPEDIANAVLYLCSPASSWLTGEVLDLNGGAHLKRYPDILSHVMKLAEARDEPLGRRAEDQEFRGQAGDCHRRGLGHRRGAVPGAGERGRRRWSAPTSTATRPSTRRRRSALKHVPRDSTSPTRRRCRRRSTRSSIEQAGSI